MGFDVNDSITPGDLSLEEAPVRCGDEIGRRDTRTVVDGADSEARGDMDARIGLSSEAMP